MTLLIKRYPGKSRGQFKANNSPSATFSINQNTRLQASGITVLTGGSCRQTQTQAPLLKISRAISTYDVKFARGDDQSPALEKGCCNKETKLSFTHTLLATLGI